MAPYVPVQRPVFHQQPLSAEGDAGVGEYSEQVLRLMHSLGIDQHKTIEVSAGGRNQQGHEGVRLKSQNFRLCHKKITFLVTLSMKTASMMCYGSI